MASLRYLWSNRISSPFGSKNFYKLWGKRIFSLCELLRRNQRRLSLINKGAIVHESAEIGEVIIEGKENQLSVGPLTFIGRVHIALHDHVSIGERVCINDNVRIFTASHDVLDPEWNHTKAKVIIEDYVWIGTGAMILPGVRLGAGAVVGAGSVVTKSVEPRTVVVGNPARPTSKKRSEKLNYNPCEFLAANRAWLAG